MELKNAVEEAVSGCGAEGGDQRRRPQGALGDEAVDHLLVGLVGAAGGGRGHGLLLPPPTAACPGFPARSAAGGEKARGRP